MQMETESGHLKNFTTITMNFLIFSAKDQNIEHILPMIYRIQTIRALVQTIFLTFWKENSVREWQPQMKMIAEDYNKSLNLNLTQALTYLTRIKMEL